MTSLAARAGAPAIVRGQVGCGFLTSRAAVTGQTLHSVGQGHKQPRCDSDELPAAAAPELARRRDKHRILSQKISWFESDRQGPALSRPALLDYLVWPLTVLTYGAPIPVPRLTHMSACPMAHDHVSRPASPDRSASRQRGKEGPDVAAVSGHCTYWPCSNNCAQLLGGGARVKRSPYLPDRRPQPPALCAVSSQYHPARHLHAHTCTSARR